MAIFYKPWQVFTRSAGQSAVACAAYRRGAVMRDERTGELHRFTDKGGVVHSELTIPPDAPAWVRQLAERHEKDPVGASAALWNRVEASEKRKDSSLAYEVILALPRELDTTQNIALMRAFVADQLASQGMVADWSVHLGKNDNPHAHVMLTMRPLSEQGFGAKKVAVLDPETGQPKRDQRGKIVYQFGSRFWRPQDDFVALRAEWAAYQNVHLARHGHDARVDHRSYAARGIDVTPTLHVGPNAKDMAARGKASDRVAEAETARRQGAREITERPERVLEMITEKKAVFTRQDMAREINRYIDDADTHRTLMARLETSPELVQLAPAEGRQPARYSTRAMIADERAMAMAAERMGERQSHGVTAASLRRGLAAYPHLEPEQRKAVEHVAGKAQIAAIVGAAGAGKSTALGAARAVWEAQGLRVRGAALSGKAAKGLQDGSGIISQTAYSLEEDWGKGQNRLGARDVLVIDEAGMLGSRMLGRLLAEAERAGAKVVLVGDPEQLQPIEAGAGFRAITDRIGHAPIETIRRQKDVWAKEATALFAKGQAADALNAYARRGHIGFEQDRAAAKATLAGDWLADRKAQPEASAIILAHTNADTQDLNETLRAARRAAGELGAEAPFQAEKGARQFAAGDRLVFLRNNRKLGVMNGTLGTVETARPGSLTVRLDDKDGREGKGPLVEVAQSAYAALDHGYAVTVHKSQGATVDRAYVLASGGMDRHLAYVSMTRHRDTARLYAGRDEFANLAHLQHKLGRRRGKETTLDYAERRGIDTPRDWWDDVCARAAAFAERMRDQIGALWNPRPLAEIVAAPPPPMAEILAKHQAKQKRSTIERETARPGAADLPDYRNEIAQAPAPSPTPTAEPGKPPALPKAEVDRLIAQDGPEKALEAARAAEFKAIEARAGRLSERMQERLEEATAANYAHYQNKPQEPAGRLASFGGGRAKFARELAEWTRQDAQIQADRERWGKRLDFVEGYRRDWTGYPGRDLAQAKTERHYPELVKDAQRAESGRTNRERPDMAQPAPSPAKPQPAQEQTPEEVMNAAIKAEFDHLRKQALRIEGSMEAVAKQQQEHRKARPQAPEQPGRLAGFGKRREFQEKLADFERDMPIWEREESRLASSHHARKQTWDKVKGLTHYAERSPGMARAEANVTRRNPQLIERGKADALKRIQEEAVRRRQAGVEVARAEREAREAQEAEAKQAKQHGRPGPKRDRGPGR